LQTTLEARLSENFGRVVEQLNKAYEVFGEMRTISAHVGDLKNVLTNPKLRGTFGEVQLAMLLQDFLSPSQYVKDAQVKEGSAERVEYAIRLPMLDGEEMLLPVDAKFPREDHEHMLEALEVGDGALVTHFRKQLENRIKTFAKDISRKYINSPRTTERAILFLPTESLFAEVLRIPGLFDFVQRECNVMLAGPTTFAAILHAFQVNHRSMAIAQRSGDVWKILSAVRTEFKRYNDTVSKVAKQLNTAAGSVAELGRRSDMMDRALRNVETMPDDSSAAKVLGLEEKLPDADSEADMLISSIVLESVTPIIVSSAVIDDESGVRD
jgi:DNA recombination protein RmuC